MKHFYWIYNGKKYYNKVQALYDSNGRNDLIKYHFMDNVLDRIDISREPLDTWNTICRGRAKQIRAKYDYVCVWFSGGWDSTEMLYSFAESNSYVNEIIIFNRTYMNDIEIPEAFQFAKSMVDMHWPGCKITIVDIDHTWHSQNYLKHKQDWILQAGASNRFSKNHRNYLINCHPTILKNREKVKGKIADVHGTDKPKLHIHENKWYCFQIDVTLMLLMETDFELFYFSPDCPEIYIKQCHMALKFFESIGVTNNDVVHEIQNSAHNNHGDVYASWNKAIGRRSAAGHSAFYGLQKPITQEIGMNVETQNLRDHYQSENKKIYNYWNDSLQEIKNSFNIDLFSSTLPVSVSKSYFLKSLR